MNSQRFLNIYSVYFKDSITEVFCIIILYDLLFEPFEEKHLLSDFFQRNDSLNDIWASPNKANAWLRVIRNNMIILFGSETSLFILLAQSLFNGALFYIYPSRWRGEERNNYNLDEISVSLWIAECWSQCTMLNEGGGVLGNYFLRHIGEGGKNKQRLFPGN